ncbi:hypothetical protein [Limimaricola cinnabarinus]|uniref:hypothetical protein n=1 Tax=Limimaricola cinnabarinus TaxID=1125964 RepID=UPI002FE1FC7F
MQRRHFLAMIPFGLGLGATAAMAQDDPLGAIFMQLSPRTRRALQEELSFGGFYDSAIDAAWGPGTRRGLISAAQYLDQNSRGRIQPDLSSARGVQTFMTGLAAREYSAWLYGEGSEGSDGF